MSLRSTICAAGLFLALLAAPRFVLGQGFTRVSVPLPILIDGQPVRSTLYLKFEMKSYNVPFDQFAAGPLDKEQTMFVTAVEAIRKKDAAKFASVWTSPNKMKSLSTTVITLVDDTPKNWIDQAWSVFDFNNVKVIAQVQMGLNTMFIWDAMTPVGSRPNAFYAGLDQKNQLRLSVVSSSATVQSILLSAFQVAESSPDAYKPLPNINLRCEYPIPLDGSAAAGAYPVFLEFDGSPMDFPLGDNKIKPPTPLLAFFRNAELAHQSGNDEAYASSFTPKSADTVRQWLASMKNRPGPPNKLLQTPLPLGNVKFILSADPVSIVFQAPAAGNDWTPENLTYSYIVQQGGSFKIANFSFNSDLDDLLQNPAFFDKRILKPASTKSPR